MKMFSINEWTYVHCADDLISGKDFKLISSSDTILGYKHNKQVIAIYGKQRNKEYSS